MLVVEFFLDHYAREGLLADLNLERSAEFGGCGIHQGHAYTLAGGNGVVACGYLTYLFPVLQYGVSMPWDSLPFQFDADDTAGDTLCLLLHQGILADKFRLVEFAEHAQTRHHRGNLGRQFIAIKRQSHLEAECVAAAQSTGFAPSAVDEFVPLAADEVVRAVNLESVLSGISCTAICP